MGHIVETALRIQNRQRVHEEWEQGLSDIRSLPTRLQMFVDVVELAHQLDCEAGVAASYLVAYDVSQLPHIAPGAEHDFERAYQAARQKGDELGVPIAFKAIAPGDTTHSTCTRPWDSAFVRCDGQVFMCTESTAHPLGDLRCESFQQIWQGKRAQAFRRSYLNQPYLCCRYCNQCQNKTATDLFAHLGGQLWNEHINHIVNNQATFQIETNTQF